MASELNASFIHGGGKQMASYRYRAEIPATELGVPLNDPTKEILIFSKPQAFELEWLEQFKVGRPKVVVDFCDDHFTRFHHYKRFAKLADEIVCPTEQMAHIIREHTGRDATVIRDPFEFPERLPHCNGTNLLWFGHKVNVHSLIRILDQLNGYSIRIVSNAEGAIPWSLETMPLEFKRADIVVMPCTAPYKSPNRTIEALRQGCFVVAEPHPSLFGIPGIWLGNIKEGIEWTLRHLPEANHRIKEAQNHVRMLYSPKTSADAWRDLLLKVRSPSTLAAERSTGKDGST